MKRTTLLVALLLAVATAAVAAPALRFRHYGVDDGLSSGYVNAIARDRAGFIWLGTAFGLNRFDGHRFVSYRHSPSDPHSLPRDYVRHLLTDRQGRLWIGTEEGLSLYRPESDDFENAIPDLYVRQISESSTGRLWLATNRGLAEFDPSTMKIAATWKHDGNDPASLSTDDTLCTLEDGTGTLWVGTNRGGLNRLGEDRRSFHRYRADGKPGSVSHDNVLSLTEDSRGRLWAGTVDGLDLYDRASDSFRVYREEAGSTGVIFTMTEDPEGGLWFGSYGGLNRFDPASGSSWTFKRDSAEPTGIVDDRIRSLFLSDEGLLWVGTTNGLDVLDLSTRRFGLVRHRPNVPDSLSDSYVWCFLRDSKGRLWIGTKSGLEIFDLQAERSIARYQHDETKPGSLSENSVFDVLEDREGRIWVATDGGGLDLLDEKSGTFTHFRNDPEDPASLSDNEVRTIHEDREGGLWIGTVRGGLNRRRPDGGFDRFPHDPKEPRSIGHPNVYSILEDRAGTLWIGTRGGLARLDRSRGDFDRFQNDPAKPDSLSDDTVFSIHEDADGVLWLGTRGGLNRFDPKAGGFRAYRTNDGLADDTVYAVLEGADGELWLSTNKGLSRFDRNAGTFANFDRRDGLQGSEFNSNAALRDPSGMLFFGGTEGLNAFLPREIGKNIQKPPVAITSFLLFNEPVPIGNGSPLEKAAAVMDAITLEHADAVFAFEFAALSYRQPEANRFRYRLEGFDDDWIPTGAGDRKAVFTNVPHGRYRFRVVASNDDGVWNEEGVSVAVTILPPWWLTWWMKLVYALLLLGAPFAFYFVRLTAYRRRQAVLEAQVAERTAEVVRQKEEIEAKASELKSANERLVELGAFKEGMTGMIVHDLKNPLNAILSGLDAPGSALPGGAMRSAARQMRNLVSDILDVQRFDEARMPVVLQSVGLREIAEGSIEQVSFLARGRRLENELPADATVEVDQELVERVLVNLLTNAIKFTEEEGRIVIREAAGTSGSSDGALVRVEVVDDGAGIPAERLDHVFDRFAQVEARGSGGARSTGLGLTFCRLAVEALGGCIGVESKLREGTIIWLTLRRADAASASGVRAPERTRASVVPGSPVGLTADERRLLAPYAAELAAIPIYRVSALNAVLARLEGETGARGVTWPARVRDAVFLADEARFRALLEEVRS
ncbi:MAG: two-component regulator propeller domain-containing protein [Thermoanaerobaculia bacterium]